MSSNTGRLGLIQWVGSDVVSSMRTGNTANMSVLDNTALYTEGTFAARPAANSFEHGHFYRPTDVSGVVYLSDGAAWQTIQLNSPASPVGAVQQFAGAADPIDADGVTRWLICNGRAISRTTYASAFTALGVVYGPGDGATTFNIPDGRGRAAIGAGTGTASDATAHALGAASGTETVQLTAAQLASHAHNIQSAVTGVGTQFATVNSIGLPFSPTSAPSSIQVNGGTSGNYVPRVTTANDWTGTTGSHAHDVNDPGHVHIASPSGSNTPHSNMQPFLALNYIVKVL